MVKILGSVSSLLAKYNPWSAKNQEQYEQSREEKIRTTIALAKNVAALAAFSSPRLLEADKKLSNHLQTAYQPPKGRQDLSKYYLRKDKAFDYNYLKSLPDDTIPFVVVGSLVRFHGMKITPSLKLVVQRYAEVLNDLKGPMGDSPDARVR